MHSNSFVDNRNKFLQYKDKILYGIFTFLAGNQLLLSHSNTLGDNFDYIIIFNNYVMVKHVTNIS